MAEVANEAPVQRQGVPAQVRRSGAVPLRELLRLPAFADARVRAGSGGLDRTVRRCRVVAAADVLPYARRDQLLVVPPAVLQDGGRDPADLVLALHEQGLAALVVEPAAVSVDVDPAGLEAAERLALPVVELPPGGDGDEVQHAVVARLLDHEVAELDRAERLHAALLAVVLAGGGLGELCREVSDLLGGPVLLTTSDGRLLAEHGEPAQLGALRSGPAFHASGRLRVEDEPPGLHSCSALLAPHAMVRVVAGGIEHGRLVAVSGDRELAPPDLPLLERAATFAALVVTKELAVHAVEGKYRGDFLRDLLVGRAGAAAEAADHCAALGWDLDRPLVVVVAELDPVPGPSGAPGPRLRPAQERFAAAWQGVVRAHDPSAPAMGFASEVVAVLGVPDGIAVPDLVDELVRAVRGDGGGGRRSSSTGVSRVVAGLEELPAAYEQAHTAVRVGRRLRGPGAVAHFDGLGSFRLLSLIPDAAELRAFADEVLGELASDDPAAVDLRGTLRVLLDTNLNVAETARRLHFHYNTLRYRIAKLERLLGPFPDDPALRLDLALALRVLEMRGLS